MSVRYQYKIDYIEAQVTDKDVKKGIAGSKTTAQVETKLTEWGEKGWEFFRSEVIHVDVKITNCFGKPTGESVTLNILMFVFRQEIR